MALGDENRAVLSGGHAGSEVALLDPAGNRLIVPTSDFLTIRGNIIDTTGPSLHKRGYRARANQAPLKETLAAAMIQLSFWRCDPDGEALVHKAFNPGSTSWKNRRSV